MNRDINWINAVRGLCIIMVYMVHCEAYYGLWLGWANVFIHPVYVNAFFFVSGYLMFRKQLSQPAIGETLKRYIATAGTGRATLSNIIFRLWLPALLFSIVTFMPKVLLKDGATGIGEFIFDTLGGGTYWFISALLLCQLFTLMLLMSRQRSLWFYVAILLLMTVAGTIALPHYGNMPDYYAFQLAPLCMGFMALGALYWRYEGLFNRLLGWPTLLMALGYVVFFILLRHEAKVLISMKMFNLTGFVGSCLGCLLLVSLCKQLPRLRYLTFVGRNSLLFYLFSGAVPVVMNVLFKRLFPVPGVVDMMVYVLSSLALATAITFIIQRWLPFLTDLRLLLTVIHPSK
jgi:fucose 4-O-acetylase-like acetyltransferase